MSPNEQSGKRGGSEKGNRVHAHSFVSQLKQLDREQCMADPDRDDTEHTTVVETNGGGGGGGVIAVVVLVIVVLVLLWMFRGQLGLGGGTNVNVPNSIDVNVNQS
jgi:hypothetical protein